MSAARCALKKRNRMAYGEQLTGGFCFLYCIEIMCAFCDSFFKQEELIDYVIVFRNIKWLKMCSFLCA